MHLIHYILLVIIIAILSYLFFRPKGWWFRLKTFLNSRERIILEDILKSLYYAREEGSTRTMKSLVQQLPFQERQILKTLTKMKETDLVNILENRVKLSNQGEEYALRIVRAHRLWEHYLAEKTGYNKKEWHKLAEKAEHRLTEEHIEQLTDELKRPLFDPHGSPIPYKQGNIREIAGNVLSSFPEGTIGKIVHIQDEPESIYRQILAEDIHLGSQIEIINSNDGTVTIVSEGKEHQLPVLVANALTIVPLEEEEIFAQLDRLSRLKIGEKASIKGISRECRGEIRRRLLDLGFVKGTSISISSISPLEDPTAYNIRNTLIALRKEEAQLVLIQKEQS